MDSEIKLLKEHKKVRGIKKLHFPYFLVQSIEVGCKGLLWLLY